MFEIIHGDVLQVIKTFETGRLNAVITDPPYSSGGATLNEKQKSTAEKCTNTKGNVKPAK